ncbi:MAG: endolytic transglycosylase MltG [Alphaproteobacteria bacterium]|nr:MAG: endolytic transglycosylase MltG [Alphaproteobacteria bacterium]
MGRVLKRVLVALVIVGAIVGAGTFYYGKLKFEAPGPVAEDGGSETVVLLPSGMSVKAIARKLEEAGVVRDARFFEIAVRIQRADGRMKAGEYAFPSGASMADVSRILQMGKSIQHKLTVAEGLTTAQILKLVAEDEVLVGEITEQPAEGTLLPETYLFVRSTTRDEIIERMRAAQQKLIDEHWDKRADNLPFDSIEDAIILASIVEKETALPEERPRIAAAFVNRLRKRMRLQSDPTIIYGLTQGEPLGRGIRRSELDRLTPYNTYLIDGLPPTPICNPGIESLLAVFNPPQTSELYFVANGEGGHVFASSHAQHMRNVEKWRRIERERKNRQ